MSSSALRRAFVDRAPAVYRTHPTFPSPRTAAALLLVPMLVLTGCAGTQPATRPAPLPEATARPVTTTEDARALLRQARRAPAGEALRLRLQAAELLADDGDLRTLAGVVDEVSASATPIGGAERWRLSLLQARLALASGDAAAAAALLASVPDARFTSALPDGTSRRALALRAEIEKARGALLPAARARVLLDGLLPVSERADNRTRIFSALTELDRATLTAARASANGEATLLGWLELAAIATGLYPTLEAQQQDVERWRRRWEDHPANEALPGRLARLPRLMAARPRHVALLLPTTGPLASVGKAVRDGFVAAQLEAAASGAFAPLLSVHDTGSRGAAEAYLDAVDRGAELIVGPLVKGDVDALASLPRLDVPVLALNGTSDGSSVPSLVQFALLPEAEGRQLAQRTRADGLERVLLLTQAAPWAGRVREAFLTSFEAAGGTVVDEQRFANTGEVGEAVTGALLVSESEARARLLRRALGGAPGTGLGQPIEFEPRRRQDVDAVIAVVDATHGATLKPALNYYFASDLPVYAPSNIHDARASTTIGDSAPLQGVRFCDMPWRLTKLPERVRMASAWPDASGSIATFHAIGVDAWRLHARLGEAASNQRIAGVTGDLLIRADGVVDRALSWAVMGDDGPVPLPRVAVDAPNRRQ